MAFDSDRNQHGLQWDRRWNTGSSIKPTFWHQPSNWNLHSRPNPTYQSVYPPIPQARPASLSPSPSPSPPMPNAIPHIPGSFPVGKAAGYEPQPQQQLSRDPHIAPVTSQLLGNTPVPIKCDYPLDKFGTGYASRFLGSLGDPQQSLRAEQQPKDSMFNKTPPQEMEESPRDIKWHPLFKSNGRPTLDMVEVLDAVGRYAFQADPSTSHEAPVLKTPDDMWKYFEEMQSVPHSFRWKAIFRLPNINLSRLYCDLGLEHHLVQCSVHQPPSIPGLTRNGFTDFMHCVVRAYPAQLYESLHRLVWRFPILSSEHPRSNWFPKDAPAISFPGYQDLRGRERLENIIAKFCDDNLVTTPMTTKFLGVPAETAPLRQGGLFGDTTTITNKTTPEPRFGQPHEQNRVPGYGMGEPPQPYSSQPVREIYLTQPGGGNVRKDSREVEFVNTRTSAHNDDFDHYRHNCCKQHCEPFGIRNTNNLNEGNLSPPVGAYDANSDNHRSKDYTTSGTEYNGSYRQDGLRSSSRTELHAAASSGHTSTTSNPRHITGQDGEYVDTGVFKYLVKDSGGEDEGERWTHERLRDGDRQRDRNTETRSGRDTRGYVNGSSLRISQSRSRVERYADDISDGSWNGDDEAYNWRGGWVGGVWGH
ncbi:hypothetical protein AJ78_05693 [Emergomyces pasteurianus Ep9510]|uniref:DUF7514 domain-containing protein n=1 Tax=Emergomyces pasteurianus Ep9510 TaxID=1447872 RepID=A0A1J9QCQ9_9EURO|nr:hypothetical protein AJ78_05693 [Emergomyces pasteurianus Ep9510]